MARPKGSPKYGGRTAGTPNRATQAKAEVIADAMVALGLVDKQSRLTPLQMVLVIAEARFTAGDHAGALAAAAIALPYCERRLASTDLHVSGQLDTRDPETVAREIAEVEALMAAARTVN
jgi:hypothetical protein